ncbi:MAG: Tm-1-like ATP-binding domain-containing protein [Candidatus Nanopelagicales bacterium]|nr:Tm-1-like ATP-binding domain-containing protein [Candidatus Nanopelagicales bacterium]
MKELVLVIGTLDTKGPEVAYVRDKLKEFGLNPYVIDVGILGEPVGITPDFSKVELAQFGGTTIEKVQNAGSRGAAVELMREFVVKKVKEMVAQNEVIGAIGLGGAEGGVMTAAALMELPIGAPKIVISPIASGKHEFAPLVGTTDMMTMHSIVDILGLNDISKTIFDNAAAAVFGMIQKGHQLAKPKPGTKAVAVTMLGNTNTAITAMQPLMKAAGYELVVFHANGVGGPAMEELAQKGQFVGIIDFTPNEMAANLVGGIHVANENRLKVAGRLGLPQVVVPGCVDFVVFHAHTVPENLKDRPLYNHNPEFWLVRLNGDEMEKLGKKFADSLNESKGAVKVVIPTQGISMPNKKGGVFFDPASDKRFMDQLQNNLNDDIEVTTFDMHVNDAEFGKAVGKLFIDMMNKESK